MSNASSLVAAAVWKVIESTRSVTDEQLSVLHFLFGKNLERATRIVDHSGVKRVLGEPSGVKKISNSGSSGNLGGRRSTSALPSSIVLVIHSSMTP